MLGCRKLAGHTDTKFGRNETKKGSVAISRSRILGKWDHRGLCGLAFGTLLRLYPGFEHSKSKNKIYKRTGIRSCRGRAGQCRSLSPLSIYMYIQYAVVSYFRRYIRYIHTYHLGRKAAHDSGGGDMAV
jgi:hypothetical protein